MKKWPKDPLELDRQSTFFYTTSVTRQQTNSEHWACKIKWDRFMTAIVTVDWEKQNPEKKAEPYERAANK